MTNALLTNVAHSKDQLIISRYDMDRLVRLLGSIEPSIEVREELRDLTREILRCTEVGSDAIPPNVVTMNSPVRITPRSRFVEITAFLPGDGDRERKDSYHAAWVDSRLSVGAVLIVMPGGIRKADRGYLSPEAAAIFILRRNGEWTSHPRAAR